MCKLCSNKEVLEQPWNTNRYMVWEKEWKQDSSTHRTDIKEESRRSSKVHSYRLHDLQYQLLHVWAPQSNNWKFREQWACRKQQKRGKKLIDKENLSIEGKWVLLNKNTPEILWIVSSNRALSITFFSAHRRTDM